MAVQTISLDRVIGSMIHHPKVDGIPLYVRVDGQVEFGDNKLVVNKSDRWIEASKRSYGSPDNIRRIFITHRAVYVHLYKPVVGVKNTSLKREVAFPTNFGEVYSEITRALVDGVQPKYRVKQLGLSAICRPWVCSNVEEIYFDMSLFLSEDIRNIGMGDMAMMFAPGQCKLLPSEPIRVLFETACMKGVKNIKDRFPRLHCIGYVQDLEEIYKRMPDKGGVESIEDIMKPWYATPLMGSYIKQPNSAVSIYSITNVPKLNTNYSLKDGLYMFDRDVLKDHFLALEARIKEYGRAQRDKNIDSKKDELVKKANIAKSSFETTIDEIYGKEGIDGATLAIRLSLDGLSKSNKLEMINNMSGEGQERYRKLAGLTE